MTSSRVRVSGATNEEFRSPALRDLHGLRGRRRALVRRIWLTGAAVGIIWECAFVLQQTVLAPLYGLAIYVGWDLVKTLISCPLLGIFLYTSVLAQNRLWLRIVGAVSMAWFLGILLAIGTPPMPLALLEVALQSTAGAVMGTVIGGNIAVIGLISLIIDWTRNGKRVERKRPNLTREDSRNLVLRPSLSSRMLPVALFGVLLIPAIYWIHQGNSFGWIMAIVIAPVFGLAAWMPLRNTLSKDKDCLVLTREGFAESYGGKKKVFSWTDVDEFWVTPGDAPGFNSAVEFKLKPGIGYSDLGGASIKKPQVVKLRDSYGMKTEELRELLDSGRRRNARVSGRN